MRIEMRGKSTIFSITPTHRLSGIHGDRTKILPDRSGAATMEASASPQMLVAGAS
jgi:hypothetical protein